MRELESDATMVPVATAHTVVLDGESVVGDEETDRIHHLNASATVIWLSLDGETTLGEVSAAVAATFGIAADEAWASTSAMAGELFDLGLVRRASA